MFKILARQADLAGLFLFIILIIYFIKLNNKTYIENILLLFVSIAAIVDFIFIIDYGINYAI